LVLGILLAPAQARPGYSKAFAEKYPNLEAAKEAKCGVCHDDPKSKKTRNDYGKAFGKDLGEKNSKDNDKINAALDKVAGEPSAVAGKTYGDLIKDGKLPDSK
jgi:hypothetical protein